MKRQRVLGPLAAFVLFAGLASACGGIKTVSHDGYRAILAFGANQRYSIAVAGEKRRVEGDFDGSKLVKIMRPDLARVWQFRPSTRKILEEKWEPTDEIVPGYPLEPHFDPQAYAERFGAEVKQVGDDTQGIHPCDRYLLTLPSQDRVMVWAARDLERLPVKLEHEKRTQDGYEPFKVVELLDIRIGADPDLFEKPKGYRPVRSYQELQK